MDQQIKELLMQFKDELKQQMQSQSKLTMQLRDELIQDMNNQRNLIVSEIKDSVNNINVKLESLDTKVNQMDRDLGKRNLILFGILEEFKDYWELENFVSCDKRVSCSQRSQVTQHIATRSHIENKNRNKERTSYQAFLTSPSSSKSTLSTDLCRALVRADIPFHKLKNPHFKGFLEFYIGEKMPDESTLRKNYLEDIYKDTLTKIREHIKDGPIWASIDETTDVEGRYIANAVTGKLDSDADVLCCINNYNL
uniref:DUF659 domain-containing protein n=1 Tax=Rhodnius prolixus TaxID=13249 RepID=T1IEP7_RHOPR